MLYLLATKSNSQKQPLEVFYRNSYFWRRTLKSETIFGNWKLFKNYEKCFLFHLKGSSCSQDIRFLSWIFGHVKKGLIRKVRLISRFTTLQSGYQTIAIHILTNISRRKGNQAIKFGQLKEHNMKHFFWKIIHKMWWRYYFHTLS